MEAIAVALAGLGSAAAVLILALKWGGAERRAGEQKARADALDVNLTNVAAMLADTTNRLNEEKARVDRIESAMAHVAAGPVAGAHERLLQAIAAARTARGDGQGSVSDESAAPLSRRGDSRLLPPGSELE